MIKWLDTVTFDILSLQQCRGYFLPCAFMWLSTLFLFRCFVFSFVYFIPLLSIDLTPGMYVVLSSLVWGLGIAFKTGNLCLGLGGIQLHLSSLKVHFEKAKFQTMANIKMRILGKLIGNCIKYSILVLKKVGMQDLASNALGYVIWLCAFM